MLSSDIIVPKPDESLEDLRCAKLVKAYIFERTQQEITEVELNRAKIVMFDENGKLKRVPLLAEH